MPGQDRHQYDADQRAANQTLREPLSDADSQRIKSWFAAVDEKIAIVIRKEFAQHKPDAGAGERAGNDAADDDGNSAWQVHVPPSLALSESSSAIARPISAFCRAGS